MKSFLKISILIVSLLFLINCTDDLDCDPGPYYGELRVKVTINDENPEVPLVVFHGRIEDQDTLYNEIVTEENTYYSLEAGQYYSATALYQSGPRQILAIDGKRMEVNDGDEETCPSASDITLRLTLAD